jgi:hypothetical protein
VRKSGAGLAAAAYTALSLAYTWPLALHMSSAVAQDRGDPLLVAWVLWCSTKAVPLTAAWWNAPAFYPSAGVLAFSEHFLGLAPIAAPIILLSHNPLLAYNVAFGASYVLTGTAGYVLGFVLTGRRDAAFVAGTAFAFAPYRLAHLQHLQLLSSYWMPLSLAALHLYFRSRRPGWAILFAAAWLMQALACGYYFFFLSVFALLWLLWFARRNSVRLFVTLACAWLAAAMLLLPILLGYRAIHAKYGFHRSPAEMLYYSADVAGLLSAPPHSLLWRGLHAVGGDESIIFPGATAVIFLFAGLWMLRRRAPVDILNPEFGIQHSAFGIQHWRAALAFYTGAALLMWLLALGPEPALLGRRFGFPGPYSLLTWLPGFDEMRVPARLWMLSVLSLAAVASLVVGAIESPKRRKWIAAAATLGFLLDGWPLAFPLVAAPESRVTANAAAARLGLPLRQNETESMYGAIPQGRPVINGYSGYEAPQHPALRDLLEMHDPQIIERLSASAPIEILVERNLDPDGAWRRYVEALPGIRRGTSGPAWTSYVIGPTGEFAPAPLLGPALPIRAITASIDQHDVGAVTDGDLDTRWNAVQNGAETLTIDLGGARHVQAIEMSVGAYVSQYPRALSVETSTDGVTWTQGFTGGAALLTYDAAIRDPRKVPITVPVDRGNVRFVRVHQTAHANRMKWSIVELRVIE